MGIFKRAINEDEDIVLVGTRAGDAIAGNSIYTKVIVTTGFESSTLNHNPYSLMAATGGNSKVVSGGVNSLAITKGYKSKAISYGSWSVAISTGFDSVADAKGRESIAMSIGCDGRAKGLIGCWLILAEREDEHIKDIKIFYVDGEKIKAGVFYKLENGVPVETDR